MVKDRILFDEPISQQMPLPPPQHESRRPPLLSDEAAYVLPMAVFLMLTQAGSWWPGFYPVMYGVKTVVVAVMLVILWPRFTRIRWTYWWLGVICGIIGVVQWVGMENLLLAHWPHYPRLSVDPFDPFAQISGTGARGSFIAFRILDAVLVVPVMEELFWRDFLWRSVLAPRDFKLAEIGEPDWKAWLIIAALFSLVHVQWMTAIVWGLMVGGLLMLTRSLGACIMMHAVTNLLLSLYVLSTGRWYFW